MFGLLAQLVEQRPFKAWVNGSNPLQLRTRLLRLGVRTTGFHPVNTGSIPVGDAFSYVTFVILNLFQELDVTFFIYPQKFLKEQVEYLVAVLGPQVGASVHLLYVLVGQLYLV